MGKIICITGIDGCGKSSICKELNNMGYSIVSHDEETLPNEFKFISRILKGINQKEFVGQWSSKRIMDTIEEICFSKAFLATLYLRQQPLVFINDYFYKWVARELVRGKIDRASINKFLNHLPKPDLCIVIKRDINMIKATKKRFSASEYIKSPDDFVSFQTEVAKVLDELITPPKFSIDNNSNIPTVVSNIMTVVSNTYVI